MTKLRTGQAPKPLNRKEFSIRFSRSFLDPTFSVAKEAIQTIESIASTNYIEGRKAPVTKKAGAGFANPKYALSVEWKATRDALIAAQLVQESPSTQSRVLLICGSARNDGTCPSEMSKTFRMVKIYEQWVAAHAVIIFTPVYWYQTPSVLKLMIDQLVCADGGNPDPTTTDGKDAKKAKALELKDWPYPKHLSGRAYGLVVHGDVAGIEGVRRGLSDWLDWMGLIDAGAQARLDRFLGYYESYAKSHEVMDKDAAFLSEVTNVALAVANAVQLLRAGELIPPDASIEKPRKK